MPTEPVPAYLSELDAARSPEHRAACASNLKQLALALHKQANEHNGLLPAPSSEPGRLMFDMDTIYPQYLDDLNLFVCPVMATPPSSFEPGMPRTDDCCYRYLGHEVTNLSEGLALVEAYRAAMAEGRSLDEDIVLPDGTVLKRLSSTSPPEAPMLIERLGHHLPLGGHVLYPDGRVEFVRDNAKFPMTSGFLAALQSLE